MTPTELLELFRLEVGDTAEPQLWSDKEFYIYLNEAQNVFVRETGGLADRRSAVTKINYKAGDQFKNYDARILRINGATDTNNRFLGIRNYDNLDNGFLANDYGNLITAIDDSLSGPIKFLITDVEAKEIQLYPKPDASGTVQLFIQRLPLKDIKDEESTLEISEQHHLELLWWVKYKCYNKQDSEVFDGQKAIDYRNAFDDCIKKAKKAIAARVDRKRAIRYGGI